VAGKIMDSAVSETDAETIRAENERLKAEIEREQLKETRDSKGKPDQWQEYIFEQMKRLQDQLTETQRALSQQQAEALHERLNLLTSEIERLQTSNSQPTNPLDTVTQTVQQAQALVEMLQPKSMPPPVSTVDDPTLRAWELRATHEHERWQAERQDRHEERLAEIADQNRIARERLEMERQHLETQGRFFRETAPKIVEVFTPIMQKIVGQMGTASTPAAVATAAQVMPSVAPGVMSESCQACGNTMLFRPEQGTVICQRCGSEYTLGAAEPPPAPQSDQEQGGIG